MGLIPLWIYITLKPSALSSLPWDVLYLYEFTLLSNDVVDRWLSDSVLYLYEFTLLSNESANDNACVLVLYLYEFTLLSNISKVIK